MNGMLRRIQRTALIAGVAGVAACVAGAFADSRQFYASWLFGWLFWLGLSLGCLPTVMLHHLTGGRWGLSIRRFLEAGIFLLPLMALLFLPLFFGLDQLYAWARPEAVAADKVLQHKSGYLNVPAFITRAVVAFGVWIALAMRLNRWSWQQDATPDLEPTRRLRMLSGPGIVVHTVVGTFAYVDWVMTLEPDWYSSIFLVLTLVGQMLSCLAFAIIVLAVLSREPPLLGIANAATFHQLGNLLLAFVLLWTYMAFSQFLIQWSGNLPREIAWYLHRSAGGWGVVIVLLAVFHFAVPFAILLLREAKRRVAPLVTIASMVLAAHVLNVFWMIAPSFHPNSFRVHWMDFAAWMGIGCVWLGVFAMQLKAHPLLPLNDPRLSDGR